MLATNQLRCIHRADSMPTPPDVLALDHRKPAGPQPLADSWRSDPPARRRRVLHKVVAMMSRRSRQTNRTYVGPAARAPSLTPVRLSCHMHGSRVDFHILVRSWPQVGEGANALSQPCTHEGHNSNSRSLCLTRCMSIGLVSVKNELAGLLLVSVGTRFSSSLGVRPKFGAMSQPSAPP